MELIPYENSYMTLEEANDIINNYYLATDDGKVAWDSLASDSDRSVLIYRTTKLFDTDSWLYIGKKADDNQKMQWPREQDNNSIMDCPDALKEGIVLLAIDKLLNSNTEEAALIKKGIQTYKIKDASVTFFEGGSKNNIDVNGLSIPSDILDILHLGDYSHICI